MGYAKGHRLKIKEYEIRAIESYQPMLDALILARPLAIKVGDDLVVAAIDKALVIAGRAIDEQTS